MQAVSYTLCIKDCGAGRDAHAEDEETPRGNKRLAGVLLIILILTALVSSAKNS